MPGPLLSIDYSLFIQTFLLFRAELSFFYHLQKERGAFAVFLLFPMDFIVIFPVVVFVEILMIFSAARLKIEIEIIYYSGG